MCVLTSYDGFVLNAMPFPPAYVISYYKCDTTYIILGTFTMACS